MAGARTRWSRLSVGHKVVAPFVALTLVAGILIAAIASQQLAASGAQQLETVAVREQDNVNTVFNSVEERQLADLRLLAATSGVAEAVRKDDVKTLGRLLLPVVANELPERIAVEVFQASGKSILKLAADPDQPDQCLCTAVTGSASFDHLNDVLNGRADEYGTRYVGIAEVGDAQLLYTIGPVIDAAGYLTGAVLVGEPLDQILSAVEDRAHVQLSLFRPDSTGIASTQRLDFPIPALSGQERDQVVGEGGVISKRVSANGHEAAVFYVPWVMRFVAAGYAALIVPADPLAGAQDVVLLVILVVCLGSLALTWLVAAVVTRSITRPMNELIKATAAVSAGNLDHRAQIDSGDEIGHLATSFNLMTAALLERTQRLEKLTDDTLVTLAAAIDARDPYTHGHSMRVSMYADAIAVGAGYEQFQRDVIKRGCMVHDIGKIGVPDSILRKSAPLEPKEWQEMRQHPLIGHRLVSGLPWDRMVLDIVLHHHERWDGTGYPTGLAGDAIPRAARIVAIADALDAMTSRRPYRPARTFRRALDDIFDGAGIQFDADLVAVVRARRREIASIVEGALRVWVPRVYRSRKGSTIELPAGGLAAMS
jgi:HD-GYP domain-containing protein (c-di-GMP phosphodiesterase class II)